LLGVLLVVGGLVWLRRAGHLGGSDQPPSELTATVDPRQKEPALRLMTPPDVDEPGADDKPPTEPAPKPDEPTIGAMSYPPATRPAVTSRPTVTPNPARAAEGFEAGMKAWKRQELLSARELLNQSLAAGLTGKDAEQARETLTELAQRTIFSRATIKGDPLTSNYQVQPGDTLGKIAKRFSITEDLLAGINNIADKDHIVLGWRLKVLHGPFHALVVRSEHVMHVYLQDVYVRSYPVALGINGTTPIGKWKVANRQENPSWTNPRTSERWHANDPENPIGEHWIGLEGIEGDALGQFGYGIHGTIEPETIGQDVSMGCVRLAPDDIAELYGLLLPGASMVTITRQALVTAETGPSWAVAGDPSLAD
jgi:LysM repeat protein